MKVTMGVWYVLWSCAIARPGVSRLSVLYCAGCNEPFDDVDMRCPRCGMSGMESSSGGVLTDPVITRDGQGVCSEVDLQVDDTLLEGQRIDIYECSRLLGRGGMGVVYLAHNSALHRWCALKVLSPRRTSADIDYIERFSIEARAAAALVHPNVVTTHAFGTVNDRHYLEMEYVAGRVLQTEIDDRGPIGPIQATQVAVGIADGLAAAHRLGIIHRDLKPDNILLCPSGRPKIGDFGLAKRVQSAESGPVQLAGTPNFMASEIFEGSPATPASDVFALGVCYYLMLTGRLPFESDSLSGLMAAVMAGNYPAVRDVNPSVPLDMAECASMMLARSTSNRPVDGSAARHMLEAVLGGTRDLGSLVFDAFDAVPMAECRANGKGFEVRLQLPEGRRQSVFLDNSEHRAGERLLLIYSICCPASPQFYEQALRLNAEVLHGGLSIRNINGEPCFVMVDTYPRATVQGEAIRRSVVEVGFQADNIERMLTGKDVN